MQPADGEVSRQGGEIGDTSQGRNGIVDLALLLKDQGTAEDRIEEFRIELQGAIEGCEGFVEAVDRILALRG